MVHWGLLCHDKKGRLVHRADDITTLMCRLSLNLRASVFWVCLTCTYFAKRHCPFQKYHWLQLMVSQYSSLLFKNICLTHHFQFFVGAENVSTFYAPYYEEGMSPYFQEQPFLKTEALPLTKLCYLLVRIPVTLCIDLILS